jgi:hypothetical protein
MTFRYHLIANVGSYKNRDGLVFRYPNSLALAHLYGPHGLYSGALKAKVALGHRIILDNGAHEGVDMDIQSYAEVVKDLKPAVVVMTDKVGISNVGSRARSLHLLNYVTPKDLPGTKFMYTPQGEDKDQVLADYEWALNRLDPSEFMLGLGQGYLCWADKDRPDTVNLEDTRVPMVEAVMKLPNADKFEFHLLGARWSAGQSRYDQFANISGVDTIKPVTCSEFRTYYPTRPPIRCINREGYHEIDEAYLAANIETFCESYHADWCRGLVSQFLTEV